MLTMSKCFIGSFMTHALITFYAFSMQHSTTLLVSPLYFSFKLLKSIPDTLSKQYSCIFTKMLTWNTLCAKRQAPKMPIWRRTHKDRHRWAPRIRVHPPSSPILQMGQPHKVKRLPGSSLLGLLSLGPCPGPAASSTIDTGERESSIVCIWPFKVCFLCPSFHSARFISFLTLPERRDGGGRKEMWMLNVTDYMQAARLPHGKSIALDLSSLSLSSFLARLAPNSIPFATHVKTRF